MPSTSRHGSTTLGVRGRAIFRELHADGKRFDPLTEALIVEACRLADRMSKLDALLQGRDDEWMRFHVNDDGSEVTVYVDSALGEARHQAVAFKHLVAEIKRALPVEEAKPSTAEVSPLAQFAAAKAARLAAASGGVQPSG